MTVGSLRDAHLRIDLGALQHNIRAQKAQLPANSHILAVVKANAYGCGLDQVAHAALRAGVDGFCVAILDEALDLRNQGINDLALVLGITPVKFARRAAENGVSLAVGSVQWLKEYQELAQKYHIKQPLRVHLALDTGMGRIGFTDVQEFAEAVKLVEAPEFDFEGIFTHFATADSADQDYFHQQFARWQEFMAVVPDKPKYCHVANSAVGMWHHDEIVGNTVRMGMSMYGGNPSGRELQPTLALRPVMSLAARLTFVKHLRAGQSIGYGKTYTAKQDEWIGTLPIGYADGYSRAMQGFYVLINGQRCEIVGRICMDEMMVRLPEKLPEGTLAVFLGRSGDQTITTNDIADYSGTINYEVMTRMSRRLHRQYITKGQGFRY